MTSTRRFILACLLLAPSMGMGQATSHDTFLGIVFNQPLSISSCSDKRRDQDQPCYWPAIGYELEMQRKHPTPRTDVKVSFPKHPEGMLGIDDYVTKRNGAVVAIKIETMGVSFQDSLLKSLSEKFGPPSERQDEVLRNGFGREAEVISAIWTTPTLRITFFGALSKFDDGQIEVMTLAEHETRKAEKAAREAAAPRF